MDALPIFRSGRVTTTAIALIQRPRTGIRDDGKSFTQGETMIRCRTSHTANERQTDKSARSPRSLVTCLWAMNRKRNRRAGCEA